MNASGGLIPFFILDDWQKQKRDFLNNLSRLPPTPAYGMGKTSTIKASSPQDLSLVPGTRRIQETHTQETLALGPQNMVEKKRAAYADVVSRLNSARERSLPFQVATAFNEAFSGIAGDPSSSKSVNMGKIWHLLQFLLGEATPPKGTLSRKMAMVIGARQHLEVGHEKYMLDIIQSHPAQAALGGSTGNLQRVRAFLRVRLRDYGILDFDATEMHRQPPMDTTWHQIYFCLRSGYYDEARSVAQTSRATRTFASQLVEWITTGGMVSSATAAAVAEESERMGRLGDRAGRSGYDKKKMLLYALVSGSRHQVERLLRDIPVLFNTIEDFMWFMLATVRVPESDSLLASTQEGLPLYTVEDLQAYLVKFDPTYYTKSGKDPLVYPYILALSLQLHAAIAYLMKEPNNEGYQIDAVHISIALADHGILSEGISGVHKPGIMDTVGEITSTIRHYGLSFIRQGNLAVALEYYVQAAAAIGGGAVSWSGHSSADQQRQRNMMLKQLLTEILMRDGGIALLLGPVGTGSEGALKRYLPDRQSQHNVLLDAARQCQDSGLYDKAVELLKRIEAFTLALDTVNQRLSEAISLVVSGHVDGEMKIAGLIQSGTDILEASRHSGAGSSSGREQLAEQQLAFRQLETILSFHRFARTGRYHDALRELSKLSFLPLTTQSPDRATTALQNVSPAVQACVPDLLKAAITCLNSTPDTDGTIRLLKNKIANFVANTLPRNWPHDLYEQVARML
ncbi:hypothetical protein O6H91_01G114000 [Diphasiastrum complanatum]|uniref:Uncharacterized protein n=1 Tax=Diphasiastrum complanatum TaxID=34168 RepID=A0ACC2EV28_DIPCM|nr:hypothetical protein O6H91_01G114000 [Diphasiastrum complanatum]